MPDDIKISALTNVNTLSDTAVFPMVQDLNGTDTTLKASMSQVAGKVAEGTTFVNLTTTAKDLVGAINEAASAGGSADITTEITTPASIQTFNDGGDNIPLKSLTTDIVPIQSGSGVPSPSNVRAISGHSTVNVGNYVKNLFDKNQTLSNGFIQSDGSIGTSSSYIYTDYIKVKPNTNYTTSGDVALSNTRNNIACYDKNFAFIERLNTDTAGGWTFTTSNNCNYIRMNLGGAGRDLNTIQLEEGTTATTYEAYKGSNITIPLGQTVYGGSLECVNGALTISKIYWEFDGSSDEPWNKVSGTGKFYILVTDIVKTYNAGKISNIYPFSGSTTSSAGVTVDKSFYTQRDENTPNYNRVWVYNSDYENYSVEQFKQVLANQPLQIVADLMTAERIHTTITGANIPTLSGLNNIYTDCGDIQSLEYFNENGNDIDSLVDLEVRLSGRIRTKTYTGDGSVPLVVTFDEVPTMILNIFGNGQGSQVICFPFVYGLTSFGGVYVTPNPWTSPTKAGGGHLLYKVAYSNGGKTMTVRASADDAGAQFNQNGDTYTIYYLV